MGTQINEDKKTDYDFVLSSELYFSKHYHYARMISSNTWILKGCITEYYLLHIILFISTVSTQNF